MSDLNHSRKVESTQAALLLAPILLALGIFVVYPAFRSFYLSFFDVDAFSMRKEFVGWENYRLLLESPQYWQSLRVTFEFVLMTTIPSVILSLAVAIGLDSNPWARGLLRTVFLMPVAISSAMAAMLWIFLYNPSAGYFNYALEKVGIIGSNWGSNWGPNWLGDGHWALFAVALTTVWKELGFNVIFFLAGLASIPSDVREAALIDGAGAWQRFWKIVLPMLAPTLTFVLVVTAINSFQSFGQIHILTGGGPAGSTDTLVYQLYRDAFQNFQTGSASAQAVILFLVMSCVSAVQFAWSRRAGGATRGA